jgi:hypothetical protein
MNDRIYPKDISSVSPRSRQYIKLFGEIHFRNVDISFDKTKLSINRDKREHIFQTIATLLKRIDFGDGKAYNLLAQADKYKSSFERNTAKKAIENQLERNKNKNRTVLNELAENEAAKIEYDDTYEKKEEEQFNTSIKGTLPEPVTSTKKIGEYTYTVEFHYSDSLMDENRIFTVNNNYKELKTIQITLNMKNKIVRSCYEGKKNPDKARQFELLCGFVELLAISKVKAESGGREPKHVLYAFNDYSGSIKWFNEE